MVLVASGCGRREDEPPPLPSPAQTAATPPPVEADWRPPLTESAQEFLTGSQRTRNPYEIVRDSLADVLASVSGDRLRMRNVRICRCREPSLTVAQARFLAAHSSRIDFLTLEHLPPEIAQEFCTCTELRFFKLTSLTLAAAQALGNNQKIIYLPAVQSLDQECAQELAKISAYLSLTGLVELQPGVAEALGRHHGILNLGSLQVLSISDAENLAMHRGPLYLPCLPTNAPALREAFADFPYALNIGGHLKACRQPPAVH